MNAKTTTTSSAVLHGAATMVRDLVADAALADRLATRTAGGPRARGAIPWDRWRRAAAADLRAQRTRPDQTLEELVAATLAGAEDAAHRRPALCTDGHCRFVGRATAAACRADPWSVVSLCAPDADDPCARTLCFDVDELGEALAAGGPNPLADLLGADDVRDALSPVELEALQWQVALVQERGGMVDAVAVHHADSGVLRRVVLPFLATWLVVLSRAGPWSASSATGPRAWSADAGLKIASGALCEPDEGRGNKEDKRADTGGLRVPIRPQEIVTTWAEHKNTERLFLRRRLFMCFLRLAIPKYEGPSPPQLRSRRCCPPPVGPATPV